MQSIVNSYDVHGLRLNVKADGPALANCIDTLLSGFSVSGIGDGGYSIGLSYGTVPSAEDPPEDMHLLWDGLLRGGVRMLYWVGPDVRRCDLLGLAQIRIDFRRRGVQITAEAGAEWAVSEWCVVLTLAELLSHGGQYLIHAASLAIENGDDPLGITFAGASGRGKTTAALAMAHSGIKLLSDDASVLTQPGHGGTDSLLIWGLPTRCKVCQGTLNILPWLKDLPKRQAVVAGEYVLNPYLVVGQHWRRCAKPIAIFLLDEHNPHEHRISSLEKTEAMRILTRENVRAVDHTASGRGGRTFRALGQLVKRADTYLLSMGPDPESLYSKLRDL
ncbi:MAG: hypothetical protein KAU28_02440, partial [Phycisphaerae bacterium]|nr:hypothetical protein [Phycisphaerae bacterium]